MNASKEIFVSIMLGGETIPVGKLWCYHRKNRESASFEYHREWLANPKRFALEPALSLTAGTNYTEKSLFGAIGDSAPDRWGRILMKRVNNTGCTLSEKDFLLGVNDETRQGALRFSESFNGKCLAHSDSRSIPPLIKLPDLLSASEKFMDDNATDEELRLLLAPGSSLGGARPKASVLDKNGELAIAKFSRKDDDTDIVRWEAVALTLANAAGINVSTFRLENIAGRPVLILKRFDREGKNRIPFLSAMSMLGASDKDDLTHSHAEIAGALIRHGSQPVNDLEELWRRMIFDIMISNKDNHLRNHGFLYAGTGWILSPAYDLNPSVDKGAFELSIDDNGTNNTIPIALKAAQIFRLSETRAKGIVEEVKSAVSNWRRIAKSFGIPANQCERMKKAFLMD